MSCKDHAVQLGTCLPCMQHAVEKLRSRLAEESRRHMEQTGELVALAEQRRVRLAEAEALLWNIRPFVYGLDRIKAIDAFLAPDSASHREDGSHG